MRASESLRTLPLVDRVFLAGRVAMVSFLVLFPVIAHGVPGSGGIYIGGIAAMVVAGLVIFTGSLVDWPTERVAWVALAFDLTAIALLIWSTAAFQDPFYPWVFGMSIAYSASIRRRDAWVIAGLASSVYLLTHMFGHGDLHQSVDQFSFLVLKTVTLVFSGYVVAYSSHRQRLREEHLFTSQDHIASLNEQLSRRLSELHAISEITEVIHSTLDFDHVGPMVLDILSKVLDLPSTCLFVIDKDKDETLFSASAGLTAAATKSYSDHIAYASDGSFQAGDAANELFACSTILDHKRLMVVFCAAGDRLERLSPEDRLVLQAVASELVVAVENSQLYKLTKRLSITDELTGLFNYRYLQQRLDDEIERARRYSRSLSMLMLDADDFKRFNDTYGHIAGDVALAEIGEVLRFAVREIDVVCRYGGEEFAVVLPETDAEGAFVVAEKIREAVAAHRFADAAGERAVRLTMSIGLSTYPSAAGDREELLRQADDALYQAKNMGRDRVRAPSIGRSYPAAVGDSGAGDASDGGL